MTLTAPTLLGGVRYETYAEPTALVADPAAGKAAVDVAFVLPAFTDDEAGLAVDFDVTQDALVFAHIDLADTFPPRLLMISDGQGLIAEHHPGWLLCARVR